MKLLVNAPAFYPTGDMARKLFWLYLASCDKHGIEPYLYGIGCQQYPGFVKMRIDGQLQFLRQHATDFTHVLCTDGWDCLYLAGLDEIISKYQKAGSPPLLSCAPETLANVGDVSNSDYAGLFDDTKKYRYFGAAMYIAEIPYVIEMYSRMAGTPRPDDVLAWADAYKAGWFKPEIDHNCELFQDESPDCVIDNGRIRNTHTGSYPCVLHCGGGYCGPNGKDDRMMPWAKALRIL